MTETNRRRRRRPKTERPEQRLMALIHGPYGSGKTTLAATLPGPWLWLDGEGGAWKLRGKRLITFEDWEADPEDIDTNTVVIVNASKFRNYRVAMDLLKGDHPFETVVLDSLTAIQEKLKEEVQGKQELGSYRKANYDVWDQLLVFMKYDLELLAQLHRPESHRPINVVVIAPSDDDFTPARPLLQGSLRKHIGRDPDIIGYLHKVSAFDDESGERIRHFVLDIDPDDDAPAVAKCRLPEVSEKFGFQIWNPDLTRDVLQVINPRPRATEDEEVQ